MDPKLWIIAGLCLLLAVALLGWWLESGRIRRGNQRRQRRAFAGESDAVELLEELGFTVVDEQTTLPWTMLVDGTPVQVRSRADMVVVRKGKRYVAEVKTGEHAPNPSIPATRRQLLEYLLAFDADGVLLVNMRDEVVQEIHFPDLAPTP